MMCNHLNASIYIIAMMEYTVEKFTDLKNPTAYTSLNKVTKTLGLKRKQVKKELLKSDSYRLHYPAPKRFRRRKVFSPYPDAVWGMDLADIRKYSKSNYNKNYILVCIDFFSRSAWFESLKTKNSNDVLTAFKKILDRSKRKPRSLNSDLGKEFVSQTFKAYTAENNITQYYTHTPIKCSMCERLIRTLFQMISKYMTHHKTKRFIQHLSRFEYIYNNSFHSSIQTPPAKVDKNNYWKVFDAQYKKIPARPRPTLSVGDIVLRVKDKPVFTKGYSQTFDKEKYIVYKVKQTNPPTYLIQSEEGGKVRRAYYARELLKIEHEEGAV